MIVNHNGAWFIRTHSMSPKLFRLKKISINETPIQEYFKSFENKFPLQIVHKAKLPDYIYMFTLLKPHCIIIQ